ncbi:similar to Saccharomyces cerevisiae YLR253W MCP2 Putative protein of unknown function [Maudiozyma saulgeensis]|uniref:ABC1 atypical kinase-like domain-containing protein n=1 Tax=Maudiozyma saulgeensis TaxID=1789683 RepID=A0A1X7R8E8_9SACH|nr:similar to Saccharomyces cerevisiae YLR253W MCP2 Putative protein of unknown function [Kazachstania saulgeensis]
MKPFLQYFPLLHISRRWASHTSKSIHMKSWKQSFYKNKKKTLFGASLASGALLYDSDGSVHNFVDHIYSTSERVGVVTQATAKCFYYYKKTLDETYPNEEARKKALSECHSQCAMITLHALSTNGGIFIKFGQHIGAMTYLLPIEWTETMIPLQDQCPESSKESINEMFVSDTGKSIDEMFSEFNEVPIGVASLAQVYIATLRSTGQKVAVKCQHPELKEFIPVDVILTKTVFALMDKVFPEYPLMWLGDELQSSIYTELDFTKEAENAINTQNYFKNFTKITALKVPDVIEAHHRILIMEYVEGKRLDNTEFIDNNHISRADVSSCLSHIFSNMIFTPNVGLHCDPHGGNLAIRPIKPTKTNPHNFEIILFDHGLYRFPKTQMRRDYARFWLALLDQDQEKMKIYAKRFANITDEQFPLFAAAITGRSIDVALHYDISTRRSKEEINSMTSRFIDGEFLPDLMSILSRIPRIVLLILKTNDLTRYLDECLNSPLGPERTFLIMTQYCANTVYGEDCERNDKKNGRWTLRWTINYIINWLCYERRRNQLFIYDTILWYRQLTTQMWNYF